MPKPPQDDPKKERLKDAIDKSKGKPKKKLPDTPPTAEDDPNPNDPPC